MFTCLVCKSPLMNCHSGSICPNGHGGIMPRQSDFDTVEAHATIMGLPRLHKCRMGFTGEATGFGYADRVHRLRDPAAGPSLEVPAEYRLGWIPGALVVLVPEDRYWEEVKLGQRKPIVGVKMPKRYQEKV